MHRRPISDSGEFPHRLLCFLCVRGTALPATNFLLPFPIANGENGRARAANGKQCDAKRAFALSTRNSPIQRSRDRLADRRISFHFFLTNRRGCFTKGRFIPFILW